MSGKLTFSKDSYYPNIWWIGESRYSKGILVNSSVAELELQGSGVEGGDYFQFSLGELEEIVAFMKQKQEQYKALDEMTRQPQEIGLYD